MRLKRLVAHKIYEIRQFLDIEGSAEHDMWLASNYIEETGGDKLDEDDIYMWFIELDENIEEYKKEE